MRMNKDMKHQKEPTTDYSSFEERKTGNLDLTQEFLKKMWVSCSWCLKIKCVCINKDNEIQAFEINSGELNEGEEFTGINEVLRCEKVVNIVRPEVLM